MKKMLKPIIFFNKKRRPLETSNVHIIAKILLPTLRERRAFAFLGKKVIAT